MYDWDVFISHASEDTETVARPLAEQKWVILRECRGWRGGCRIEGRIQKSLWGYRWGFERVAISPKIRHAKGKFHRDRKTIDFASDRGWFPSSPLRWRWHA
jgi:hypothetical protein